MGKMKHLSLLLTFFDKVVRSVPPEQLVEIAKLMQKRAVVDKVLSLRRAGKEIPQELAAIVLDMDADSVSVEALAQSVLNRSGLLVTVLHAVIDLLPKLMGAMSNLPESEFEELEADEALAVMAAVFTLNYAFFSQNLPQLIPRFAAMLGARLAG